MLRAIAGVALWLHGEHPVAWILLWLGLGMTVGIITGLIVK